MEREGLNVLKALCKYNETEEYKVITYTDIEKVLPVDLQLDNLKVNEVISNLTENDLISLKFSDENTYCYAISPKARHIVEVSVQPKKEEPIKKSAQKITFPKKWLAFICASSFFGSLVAQFLFLIL